MSMIDKSSELQRELEQVRRERDAMREVVEAARAIDQMAFLPSFSARYTTLWSKLLEIGAAFRKLDGAG